MIEKNFEIKVHPGEVLKDDLEEMGLTLEEFAAGIREDLQILREFCDGKKPINGKLAKKFSLAIGSTPEFWFKLQASWELSQVQDEDYSYIKEKFAA